MESENVSAGSASSTDAGNRTFPGWLACPACRQALIATNDSVVCQGCRREYGREGGFLNLLLDPSDRFRDERQEGRDLTEENSNTYSTLNYVLPLMKRLHGGRERRTRVLSCGCGVGIDVDLMVDGGFDAYGIDCGERFWIWSRRRHPERFYVGNAKALPCSDNTFDFIAADCLLPHVGVEGDTTRVVSDYTAQRALVARELARVVKPGGHILMASPNRLCPADMHHLQPNPARLARLHSPHEPFLLSLADYRRLFLGLARCRSIRALPPDGYWGFLQKREDPDGGSSSLRSGSSCGLCPRPSCGRSCRRR